MFQLKISTSALLNGLAQHATARTEDAVAIADGTDVFACSFAASALGRWADDYDPDPSEAAFARSRAADRDDDERGPRRVDICVQLNGDVIAHLRGVPLEHGDTLVIDPSGDPYVAPQPLAAHAFYG